VATIIFNSASVAQTVLLALTPLPAPSSDKNAAKRRAPADYSFEMTNVDLICTSFNTNKSITREAGWEGANVVAD